MITSMTMPSVRPENISALLIEDDSHERFAIKRALPRENLIILECETAEEAIGRLEHSPFEFDVIISDLKLPGMDGLTLFRTLRQMKCSTPFILLTGNGSEQIAIEAFKSGVDEYVIKASHSGYLDMLWPRVRQVVLQSRLKTRNELLELSIKEANERFQQFMEHYHGIFWLIDSQESQRLLYVSPTYEMIWGRPVHSLYQNPLDWLEAVHPIERERIQTRYQTQDTIGEYNETYRIIRSDGSIRWIHDRRLTTHKPSGNLYRIVRLTEDITDQTRKSTSLQTSEERFAQFMAHLPGLAYMKDDHGRFMYLNPAFEHSFNVTAHDWMGKTLHDVLPHDTAERLQHNDEWVISHNQALEFLEEAPLNDGRHHFLTVKFPILRKDQSPMLGGVSIDVTDRFKTEAQRDQIFSLSPDLLCMIGLDGYLKKINPAFEKLLGFTQDELLAQPLVSFTHPDDRVSTLAAFNQLAEEQGVFDFHNRLQDIRGNYLWLDWRATGRPHEHVIYAVARDITQRYYAMEALRRYEQIVSTSPDFLCFIDEHNCFQAVNQRFSEFFNLPVRDITGRHIRDFVGQDIFESQLAFHLDDCRTGRGVRFQHPLKFPTGTLRFMEVWLSPYLEPDGSISGVTATWRDLTEQKSLEQHVAQTQKMESMGTFAGGIAHDFNNILMAILGWAEMGALKFSTDSPGQRYFEQIDIAGKRGRDLIQQILTFSRRTEHQPRPVDLGAVIEESMTFLRATLPSCIEFRFSNHQKMNMVFADPVHIQRIIMNLCSNAEHVLRPHGGTLTIELDIITIEAGSSKFPPSLVPGRYAQLSVSDSGPGIPEHLLPKIFDPFFTTKPAGEGTGMGLSVVHGIVKNLHGHISVESCKGSGTVFSIVLPEYTMPIGSNDVLPRHSLRTGKEHILFVDDEVSVTQILKEFMEHLGYTVTAQSNALEALEVFRKNPQAFDCLITDQTMPRLGGDQLAREILKIRPKMPIILLTGFSHSIDKGKALAHGITAFLYKPITLDQLSQTLADAFSRSKAGES